MPAKRCNYAVINLDDSTRGCGVGSLLAIPEDDSTRGCGVASTRASGSVATGGASVASQVTAAPESGSDDYTYDHCVAGSWEPGAWEGAQFWDDAWGFNWQSLGPVWLPMPDGPHGSQPSQQRSQQPSQKRSNK